MALPPAAARPARRGTAGQCPHACARGAAPLRRCNTFTEDEVCQRCANPRRDAAAVRGRDAGRSRDDRADAVPQRPLLRADGAAVPARWHRPRELRLDKLIARATEEGVREVILATNFTNEGEATAHTVASLLGAWRQRSAVCRAAYPSAASWSTPTIGTIAQALTSGERSDPDAAAAQRECPPRAPTRCLFSRRKPCSGWRSGFCAFSAADVFDIIGWLFVSRSFVFLLGRGS